MEENKNIHKLTKAFMKELNITYKQAIFLTFIARNGFATTKILYIQNVIDGVKGITNAYTRVKQLEKKKLIRLERTSLHGSEFVLFPTQKVKDVAKTVNYNVPPRPKSSVQLRHNAIALAVILIENDLRGLDGYMTTNQINAMKDKNKWMSKTPDAVLINKARAKGYLVEVELHVKKPSAYERAFLNIFIEEKVPVISQGWYSNLYYVDTKQKQKRLEKLFTKMSEHKVETIAVTAQNTKVILLSDLLNNFNEKHNSDVKLEIFDDVL